MKIRWGTKLPSGNVCKWGTEGFARSAVERSKTFPDGAHLLVFRYVSDWFEEDAPTPDKESAWLLKQWDSQIVGDLKARQTLCDQIDRYEAKIAELNTEISRLNLKIAILESGQSR